MSASSRTTVKSQSTQVWNASRFPVKALTWLACGVQSGADIRKTTTTTIIPAGRGSGYKTRDGRLHKSEVTYEWVARRVGEEDDEDVPHWTPHLPPGSRQGYGSGGGGMPAGRPLRSSHIRGPSIEPPRMRYPPHPPAQGKTPQSPAQRRPPNPPAQSKYRQGPAQGRSELPIQGRPPPPSAQRRPPPPPP